MKRSLRLLSALLLVAAIPSRGATVAELRDAIASSGDPLAGIYRATDVGGSLAVIPSGAPGSYSIVVVDAATPALRPGTEIGRMRAAGEKGTYVGELMSKISGGAPSGPKKVTFKASDDSRLVIHPKRAKIRVRLWKLLPYMFRAPITVDNRGGDAAPEGLVRVWPESPSAPPAIPRAL
ncbi:MAG: hypothetical protein NC210_01800 [[Clostridium] fimetarium]|nr:hypothetical protein [Alistipes timonensis]MCM1405137.1 hypothetical protein [[Clostridium] fimetarium]